MYNVVTATGNEIINNDLNNLKKYNIMFSDIAYQEALIEIIRNKDVDKIIMYENLPGEKEKKEFLEELLKICPKTEILMIVDKKNDKIQKKFNELGIYKLIDSNNITIENIVLLLEKDVNISVEKKIDISNLEIKKDVEYNKKIITINGTNGSGKTTVAINLAITIAKNTNKKVLLIDMDTIGANVEVFLNIPKINNKKDINLDLDKECVLNYFTECIQKGIFDFSVFQEGIIKYENIDIITGNTSMFVCQNVLCDKYYDIILNKAQELYDCIVIDTNSNLFLDSTKWAMEKSDIVYYVLEGTYKDLKRFKNTMIVVSKSWNIISKKIELILNKKTNYHLEKYFIKTIVDNEIKQEILYNQDYIKALNNGVPVISINRNILKEYEKIIGKKDEKNKILNLLGGKKDDNKSFRNKSKT